MNYYLIRFEYEHYCQGYEWTTETLLVKADTYIKAVNMIDSKYKNARGYENLTLEN